LGTTRIILVGEVSQDVRDELEELGGLEQTKLSYIELEEKTSSTGVFVMGIVIGAIFIVLLSSLWGAGFFTKKESIPTGLLNEDEQRIIEVITQNGGVIHQKRIPKLTEFSRPKVSRLVSELKERGIISKKKIGKTYTVKLEKKLK
jgi:hypothetical protein